MAAKGRVSIMPLRFLAQADVAEKLLHSLRKAQIYDGLKVYVVLWSEETLGIDS